MMLSKLVRLRVINHSNKSARNKSAVYAVLGQQNEPVLQPGVRHTVEARERALAMGATAVMHEFQLHKQLVVGFFVCLLVSVSFCFT